MPILTMPLSDEGPVVPLIVGVSAPRANALRAADKPVPHPIQLRALIDTGCSCTCVVVGMLAPLALTAIGSVTLHTPSTGNTPATCQQYDVSLALLNFTVDIWPIVECQPLAPRTIDALLGRDFLTRCLYVHDGKAKQFSLEY